MACTEHLATLGVVEALQGVASPDDERRIVRRAYLSLALSNHPDKGGDPDRFEVIQVAWEALVAATKDFSVPLAEAVVTAPTTPPRARTTAAAYEAAAAAGVPGIRVELAKSSRSVCKATGEAIPKGALRAGKLEAFSGTYGAWTCLSAWRVPAVVYDNFAGSDVVETLVPVLLGLDGILLDGLRSCCAMICAALHRLAWAWWRHR